MTGPRDLRSHRGHTISKRLGRGLLLLVTAHDYAVDLGRDRWDFATEIGTLKRLGLTKNDFRWLVGKGFVQHAAEITMPGTAQRQFQAEGESTFTAKTCFVLTDKGLAEMESLLKTADRTKPVSAVESNSRPSDGPRDGNGASPPTDETVPRWDAMRHELRLGPHLVKAFKLPSPNQETILMVFEEEGWPPRIDDPLPPHPDMIPKQRLHDTIKSLNRNQRKRLLRFLGDGTGLGVCWELISEASRVAQPHEAGSPS